MSRHPVETARRGRHSVAARLGIAGSGLGLLAGLVQATVGSRIPDWTGAKLAPGSLGLLTIGLSLLAGLAAARQNRALPVGPRTACALVLLAAGLLCFSTVGRLWYLPGPLLLLAGILSVDSVRDTAAAAARNWWRCLLGVLGGVELLMAAGASPVLLAVGAISGIALLLAAAVARTRTALAALLVIGTVPFAVLAWTAVVPVLLLLLAAALTVPLIRAAPARSPAHL
jgi:hypothetical protein